jgi:TRAP-type mannitol/chloroaromatic compound transport system permease small subunit
MPFHDDASPSQRDAAKQERSRRRGGKADTRYRVNEHVFTGAVFVIIQGVATWLSGIVVPGGRPVKPTTEATRLELA